MKFCKQAILLSVVALGLGACSDENPWGLQQGEGGISLKLSASADVKDAIPVLRSGAPTLEAPDVANFGVSLTNLSTTEVQTWSTVADFNAQNSFRTGSYTLAAFYGSPEDEGFEKPYFYGETEVMVLEGRQATAEVTARLANSMVSVDYTDGFKNYFKDYKVTVHSDGHSYIDFAADETRPAFVAPGEVSIAVDVTNPSGKSVTLQPAAFPAAAAHHYHVTFDVNTGIAGQAQLQITFDDTVESEDVTIDLTDELFSSAAPAVATEGFENGEVVEALSGNSAAKDALRFNVIARGGITSATLTISGNGFTPSFGNEIDLVTATDSQQKAIADLGIKVLGLYKNPSAMAYVDVTELPKHLPEGSFAVSLVVKDAYTRISEPATLNITTVPVVVESTPGSAIFGTNQATLTIDYNGANPEKNFSFKALANTGTYKDVQIVSVNESTRTRSFETKSYIFTITLPDTDRDEIPVKVFFNGAERQEAVIPVVKPEYDIQVDAFSNYAKVMVVPENTSDLAAVVNVLKLFKDGTKIADSAISRNNESGIITISGLTPSATFTLGETLTGSTPNKTVNVTTEAQTDVPNGDFSAVHETINKSDVDISGKYSYTVGYQATVTMQRSEADNWASINAKTCWFDCPGAINTWFQVPSTYVENGQVVIRNVAYDHNGVKPADMRTGIAQTHWYNTNVPTFTTAAAGELFLGEYSFDGSEHRTNGISFASRPTSVSFDYKYVPTESDTALVEVSILDASGNVIAYGTSNLTSASSMRSSSVVLPSYPFGKKAAKLCIRFLSSNSGSGVLNYIHIPSGSELSEGHGALNFGNTANSNRAVNDYHALATGSVLTVDNVKLNY